MNNIVKIRRASRKFRILFTILIIITPLLPVLVWLNYNYLPPVMKLQIFGNLHVGMIPVLPLHTRVMSVAVSLLPAGVTVAGLYYLIRLFGLYEQGKIFLRENVAYYRKLGFIIIYSMIASIVYSSLMTTVLTLDNPPGQRMISFGISSAEIARLVIGLIVLLVSWIMDIGREIQEEQQLTV